MTKWRQIFYSFIVLVVSATLYGGYLNENSNSTYVNNEIFVEIPVTVGVNYPLDGILTLPKDVLDPPVVLLVQGSGQSDKNETIFENTPFLDLAHGLAEYGVASLRYDKRFFVYTEEAKKLGADLNLEDEILEDVGFALDLLKDDPRVGEIFVLGHSLGGMLTPVIASQHDFLSGIISMAGSPFPLYEISYRQNKEIEESFLKNSMDEESLALLQQQMEGVERDIQILRGDFSHLPNEDILLGLPVGYQKSVKKYAGENYIEDLEMPMLILQGEADFQVTLEDYQGYQRLLEGKNKVYFHLYPELNHLLMPTTGVRDISDYYKKNTVDGKVIYDIVEFVTEISY